MLHLDDLGHSNDQECLELLKQFVRIRDADVREGVLGLMEDLANETGELVFVEGNVTFPVS
jgi:hypothetical protein